MVLRYGKKLVRFHDLCDAKRMVKKRIFFFLGRKCLVFCKNFGRRYLIGENLDFL